MRRTAPTAARRRPICRKSRGTIPARATCCLAIWARFQPMAKAACANLLFWEAGICTANQEPYACCDGPGSGICPQPEFSLELAGGGGGPSSCASGAPSTSGVVSGTCKGWTKPGYQSVLGNPSDGVRDLPDVALFAADGLWGHCYVFCNSNPADMNSCAG